jgi:hypothetical protein
LFYLQDFFKRHGVGVMTVIELFVFIFDASIVDSAVANYLEDVFVISHCLHSPNNFKHMLIVFLHFPGATKNFDQRRCIYRG